MCPLWWLDIFIIMKWLSCPLLPLFWNLLCLVFIDILQLSFDECPSGLSLVILFHFSLFAFFNIKQISCRQHKVVSCFLIYSISAVLIEMFRSLALNEFMVWLGFNLQLCYVFSLCIICWFLFSLSFGLTDYFYDFIHLFCWLFTCNSLLCYFSSYFMVIVCSLSCHGLLSTGPLKLKNFTPIYLYLFLPDFPPIFYFSKCYKTHNTVLLVLLQIVNFLKKRFKQWKKHAFSAFPCDFHFWHFLSLCVDMDFHMCHFPRVRRTSFNVSYSLDFRFSHVVFWKIIQTC